MKISLGISLLILAAAAGLGWHDHNRLAGVRARHQTLVAEAATLGISPGSNSTGPSVQITKRERENREADAKKAAAEFIAFAREMEEIEKKGGRPEEAAQKRIMEFMDRMMSLDASQLKILIAEVRASKELKDDTRKGLIGFSIMTLANDHPQAALALYTESSDLFGENDEMASHVISSSLGKWAKDDPMAALEWVRKNGGKHPDIVNDEAKRGLISGAAVQDPKLAFSLIGELGLKDSDNAVRGIIGAARTPAGRTATLAAFRSYLGTLEDGDARSSARINGFASFASGVVRDGFEAGTKWLSSADLSTEELAGFIGGMPSHSTKNDENGRWIEWMGAALPDGKADKQIGSFVRNWTENDYQAAGQWLASTPEGSTKNAAARSYAETVSRYEPETAAQWAMTLPPGEARDKTLKRIHDNWPDGDPAAKEAFKQAHGIK